ncbi:MAG: pantoate--beta-alanine ligase [Actinomycetota bacterium]|nr:pantoate--beta-alanine ligase [Actinomycetota bacterium]
MRVVTTAAELPAPGLRSGPRAVVMTMGALHEGHVELLHVARREAGDDGLVMATIFVNPTQFGAGEDFGRYPRALEADVAACEAAGVDVVLAPDVREVYGDTGGFRADSITIDPGPLGDVLEGTARPGHFSGMLTVVHKLMWLTQPEIAIYGEKDYQQLVLIRRMVADLSMRVRVVGVSTVRESDGLAMSSRNRYLSEGGRRAARAVPRALDAVVAALPGGVEAAIAAGRAVVDAEPAVALDYLVVTDAELRTPPAAGPARALIAAVVDGTRLIDNQPCVVGP